MGEGLTVMKNSYFRPCDGVTREEMLRCCNTGSALLRAARIVIRQQQPAISRD